jgi:hypothetical protein
MCENQKIYFNKSQYIHPTRDLFQESIVPSIRIGTRVGHGQGANATMGNVKILIGKGATVYRFATWSFM